MLAQRVATGVFVLWLVSVLAFLLGHMVPGDPTESLAGENASAETVAAIRAQLGLDQPFWRQYADWIGGVLHGDLGTSIFTGQSVSSELTEAAPVTLSITLLALVISTVVGMALGLAAGLNQGSWLDRAILAVAGVGIAMPNFWAAMILILIFAVANSWLPATGYVPISDGIGPWLSHVIIPATTLGLSSAAVLARYTRGCVADVLDKPYVTTARARGASGLRLIRRHILRNAAIPVVTVIGLEIGFLLGGSIVIESVSGISGLGTLATTSVLQHDYPTFQSYVLLCAVIVVTVNLLVDIAYMIINPKLRAS